MSIYLTSLPFRCDPLRDADAATQSRARRRIEEAQTQHRLRCFWTGRALPPEHPLVILLDPANWNADELRELQRWWGRQEDHAFCRCAPEILLLQPVDGRDRVARLVLCARADRAALLRELFAAPRAVPAAGTEAGRAEDLPWFQFVVEPRDRPDDLDEGGRRHVLDDEFVDRLIVELWGGNRPVLGWRSHFFQILRRPGGPLSYDYQCVEAIDACRTEQIYFLHHLQAILAPAAPQKIGDQKDDEEKVKAWLNDDKILRSFAFRWEWLVRRQFRFRVTRAGDYPHGFSLPLSALRVHFLRDDLVAVEWEVGEPLSAAAEQLLDQRLWCRLFCPQWTAATLPLAQVIEANGRLRQCYSPYASASETSIFVELIEGEKASLAASLDYGAVVSERPLDGWFRCVAKLALDPFGIGIEQLDRPFGDAGANPRFGLVMDERARIVSSIVLEGVWAPRTKAATERFTQLRARLHTADPYDNGFYYAPDFSREELEKGSYPRFAEWGSFYSVSSHSFVYCGIAGRYAMNPIHSDHMARPYRRMFLLAFFYQTALESFSRDIAQLTRDIPLDDLARFNRKLKPLRQKFIRFANGLWFDEVTPQIQGIELFAMMRERLRLRDIYEEIKEEIEVSDDYMREQALTELSQRTAKLTGIASRVAIGALALALVALCMQFIDVFEPKWLWARDLVGREAEWMHRAVNRLTHHVTRDSNGWLYLGFGVLIILAWYARGIWCWTKRLCVRARLFVTRDWR